MTETTVPIHQAAATGYAAKADLYTRGRPEYPDETLAWLRDRLGLRPGKTVVDLGAGSGKFTAYLLQTGASVIAIEPVSQMLAKLSLAQPDVESHQGTAEAIPLADASVDAVVCAQAFHWFATSAALTEIHRILKPGGALGLIWNVRDESVAWVKTLAAIFDAHEGDAPRYTKGHWSSAFPFAGFGPLQEDHFRHGHSGAAQDVIVNRVRSTSFIAALPPDEEARVVAAVEALIAATPDLAQAGEVTMPYVTDAFSTRKISG